ncbi:hypothetical protein D3C80_1823860 [compost metagenome]
MAKASLGPTKEKLAAKAMEKNSAVSSTEPSMEPASGACHQRWRRRRLNTEISSSWPIR